MIDPLATLMGPKPTGQLQHLNQALICGCEQISAMITVTVC